MSETVLNNDDERFTQFGQVLHSAISASIRPWLKHEVLSRIDVHDNNLEEVIEQVACAVERSVFELVQADIDEPLSGPLERIRQNVQPLNAALDDRGAQRPVRNVMDQQMRPNDHYDLGPMTFRDLGDAVHDAGITWGAAKAHLHLQRRR